ncbi:MAG: hypothetical protein AB8G14_12530 [Ilumatobacter sp.]
MRTSFLALAAIAALSACGSSGPGETATQDTATQGTATQGTAPAATSTLDIADTEPDSDTDTEPDSAAVQEFPDVIDASAQLAGDTWTIAATLSSPYDTPERYADAWRVVGADGTVYGERILTHDHASEQPFTRSQSGIEIPDDVTEVTIEGRDLANGYGGDTFVLVLDR